MWDEESIAKAFEDEGVTLIRMEENEHTNVEFLKKIKEEKPDLVLFTKLNTRENGKVLIEELKRLGIKTASWTFDLLKGHPSREPMLKAFHWLEADYVFLTDGGHDYAPLKKFTLRQGIPKVFNYIAPKTTVPEIIFVGSDNTFFPYRRMVMDFLKKEYGKRFHWYGEKNSFEKRGHDLNSLYSGAKIVIGCSMPSPNYWSNRLYEITGRGGFTIFPYIEGIEKEFEIDKEIVTYTQGNLGELKEKIDYYLNNNEERERIALNGFNRAKNYTFNHRVQEFLTIWQSLSTI